MTNQEILDKAFKQAFLNGWLPDEFPYTKLERVEYYRGNTLLFHLRSKDTYGTTFSTALFTQLFRHDFAKALWGDFFDPSNPIGEVPTDQRSFLLNAPAWQRHLMLMVIADDPIKYLGENL